MQSQITHSAQTLSAPFNQALMHDRRFHPNLGGVTRGGIANHYPMTLMALHGLGASDQDLERFNQSWPRHRAELEQLGLSDHPQVTAANWPEFLGQSAKLLAFRRVFGEWLSQAPADQVIAEALGRMQNALPMGLFHPLIRLSFAAQHGDPGLIADALAYLAIRYVDLFGQLAPASEPAAHAAAGWRRLDSLQLTLPAGASLSICEQLCAAAKLQQAASLPDSKTAIAEICRLALRLYLFEPSLTTLHAVTAAQALADLQQRARPEQQDVYAKLWRRYWIWLTGLYLEKGQPAGLPDLEPETNLSHLAEWDQLAAQARVLPEVHLIKMAYSCRWLDQAFGPEPLYRIAVSNMLKERRAHPRGGSGLPAKAL
ncbi:MAG: hypothetical protein CVV27_01880 [Candidatus Melainabacteria bacterium HGW-Melainabacteria-1]|nr:MAG: hypothetical protein CVV27_01880 [Candidatus Melainabacteria bacterium HGW-Melainabacteria-1]